MTRRAAFLSSVVVAGLVATMTAAPLRAETIDKLTFLTFSGNVQVPGVKLNAGTYRFRLANADTSRNVVQVLSHDGSIVYAMLHTMPASRTVVTNESTVTFRETPAGVPPEVKALFYGGERSGYEFVYPKGEATVVERVPAATANHLRSDSRSGRDRGVDQDRAAAEAGTGGERRCAAGRTASTTGGASEDREPRAARGALAAWRRSSSASALGCFASSSPSSETRPHSLAGSSRQTALAVEVNDAATGARRTSSRPLDRARIRGAAERQPSGVRRSPSKQTWSCCRSPSSTGMVPSSRA